MRRTRDRKRPAPGVRLTATLTAALIVAAAFALSGLALIGLVRHSLVSNLDATANARAQDVAALVRAGNLRPAVASTGQETAVVQVVNAAGRVVSASPNITGEGPVLAQPPAGRTRVNLTVRGLPIGEGAQQYRIVAQPVTLQDGPGWIYVATSLRQVEVAVNGLRNLLVVGLPLLLVLVAAAIWKAVGRALRPVEEIRQRAALIGGSDLQQRVPVPTTNDEIARLAETMNQMLARLEDASQRQRHFVGDASHELRSPLAAMQAQIDVALAHPNLTASTQVMQSLQGQSERMTQLIEDLLFLARADEGRLTSERGVVDLDELVLAEIRRLRAYGRANIEAGTTDAARVSGSARDLARLLRNLGDNAVAHARTTVSIGLTTTEVDATIMVTDDGPGVPIEERDRIFTRFARADQARARPRNGTGFGLGLAIARQIVEAHGGAIRIDEVTTAVRGASFVVRLPLAEPSGPARVGAEPGSTVAGGEYPPGHDRP